MRTLAISLGLALALAGLLGLSGCGDDGGGPWSAPGWRATHRLLGDEPYYVASPAQGRPPDGTWAKGTAVRLLEEAGSYARVEEEGGPTAYVASGALERIP